MKSLHRQILNALTIRLILSIAVLPLAAGCGKKSAELDSDQAYLIADSAVSSVNGSLNDSEQANSYAVNTHPGFEVIPTAYAASCGSSRFSPAIGGNCNSTAGTKTVISNFAGCTAGRSDEFIFEGQVTLTFDSNATCNTWLSGSGLPTSGSLTRTTTNFARVNPNGSTVTVSSANHSNYTGAVIGGGIVTTFGATTRSLTIAGLHRVRTSSAGLLIFDHSVTTTSPIVASGTRLAGNRVISGGTVKVDHNRAKFSSLANLSGLTWNSSCCHPISGSVTFSLTGAETGSIQVDYASGTCGQAIVTKNGESLGTVDLPSCE